MKEYPILFKGPMVQAILDGRKTQTRRVIKPQPWIEIDAEIINQGSPGEEQHGPNFIPVWPQGHKLSGEMLHRGQCPYGQPGDRLWVRETWNAWLTGVDECDPYLWTSLKGHDRSNYEFGDIAYRATDAPLDPHTDDPLWSPSIHMPRWASRIMLEVKWVRVERVQEITWQNTLAEGIEYDLCCNGADCSCRGLPIDNPIPDFQLLWDSINAKRGYGWDVNPWVWVIDFAWLEEK